MATYHNTPNVTAAVSATRTTTGTLYTCPVNSYAIINVSFQNSSDTLSIDGKVILVSAPGAVELNGGQIIYVGPGQAVTVTSTGGYINATGVQFTNGG